MIVKAPHVFTPENLESIDFTISLVYRGDKGPLPKRISFRKFQVIRALVYANKVVADYLRQV